MSGAARRAAPAVAAAAVLLLGACGGDSGEEESGSGGSQPSQDAQEGQDTGGGAPSAEELSGYWATGVQPPFDVLVFEGGTVTHTNNSGDRVCAGQIVDDSLQLVCENGESANGTVALQGEELAVSWESGGPETYQRVDDAALDQLPDLGDIPGMEDLQDLEGALEGLGE